MNQYMKLVLLVDDGTSVVKPFKPVITESHNNDYTSKNVDENSAHEVFSGLVCSEV
jgi:hypothetical protein